MKTIYKVLFNLSLSILLLAACQSDSDESYLPTWLQDSIENDEAIISENPMSGKAYGTWIQTTWQNDLYYEYVNMLSSFIHRPISFDGDTLQIALLSTYHQEKCCEVIVWEGGI